ncbi:MAG: hypothetical protein HYX28_00440 [Candidatus Koribacter versatilis]|uniref:Uncharacterized protein n=1 Tax=Candidatus Korobacter versatilis TaxID=658062 RepID=A0A932A5U0_9BACT|nr:hypothetical protein [Candidatus Koribacter versatilis]
MVWSWAGGWAFAQSPAWTPLGPAPLLSDGSRSGTQDYGPVAGRATSIAIDPSDPTSNIVYAGTSGAGVWRSWNGAASDPATVTWERLTDPDTWPVIGALAIKPNNSDVILAGTGEGNNSADSFYGFGMLRSTDRGANWSLITSADSGARSFRGLAFARIAFSADNPELVVAATASTFNELAGADGLGVTHGLYYSTDAGATWHYANIDSIAASPPPDATAVVYNAALHAFFAAIRRHGFYKSTDGINWTRLLTQPGSLSLTACPNASHSLFCPLIRAELAVKPGSNEMYAWYINVTSLTQQPSRGIYKTLDGGTTWTTVSTTSLDGCGETGCGAQTGGYAYNLTLAAVPRVAGTTDLYAGAVNLFKCAVTSLNPICSTAGPWLNLTHVYGCTPLAAPAHVFPAFHDVAFLPANPNVLYFATDGGVYRTLNSGGLNSSSCSAHLPFDNLNRALGSLFDIPYLTAHPADPDTLLAATRDNFSVVRSPALPDPNGTTWSALTAGNSPFAGHVAIDPASPNTWFTSRTGDVDISRCTLGAACRSTDFSSVVTPTTLGGDHGGFYVPYLLDPAATGKMLVGTCRVWRGPSNGAGWSASNVLSNTFQPGGAVPCSGSETNLVTQLAAGGPATGNGSQVIYATTSADNFNTFSGGRIWVTTNADGGPTTWLDRTGSLNPNLYNYSALVVDPADATGGTAYVALRAYTGAGKKIWKTTDAGVNWADVSITLPNVPVNALILDPLDHNILYAATDVGVFLSPNQGAAWSSYNEGLPLTPIQQLAAQTAAGANQLLAGTHAAGVWATALHKNSDYAITTQAPTSVSVQQTVAAVYHVALSTADGFDQPVTLSCAGLPSGGSCGFSPNQVTPTLGGVDVTVTVSTTLASTPGSYTFTIHGLGGGTGHDAAPAPELVLNVVPDFGLEAASLKAVRPGDTASFAVSVARNGTFASLVDLTCVGTMPAGATCSVTPPQVDLASGNQPATVSVTTTGGTTPVGDTGFTLHGAEVGGSKQHDLPLTLRVNDFSIGSATASQNIQQGSAGTYTVTVTGQNNWTAPVTLSCANFTSLGLACGFSQNNFVPATGGTSLTVTVNAGVNAAIASGTFDVVATDGTTPHSVSRAYNVIVVQDFQYIADSPDTQTIVRGATAGWNTHLLPLNEFAASVTTTCAITAAPAGAVCSATPSPIAIGSATPQPLAVAISTTSATPTGNYAVTVTAAGGTKTHALNFTLSVQGATLALSPSSRTIPAGSGTTYAVSATAQNGFAGALTLACGTPPAGVTCAFNPATVTPGGGSSTLTVLTTTAVTAGMKTLVVAGTLGGVTPVAQANAGLTISSSTPSFTLTNSTATRSLAIGGGSTTYSLSVRSTLATSPGTVTMSCVSPLPAGVSCSFSPASFSPTTIARAVTATVTATNAAAAGSYPLGFQAATTTQLRRATGTLNLTDFALAVTPGSQQIGSTTGGTATYDVALTTASNFAASVTLACTGLPAGASCGFAPSSMTPSASGAHSTLTLTTTASTPGGSSLFNVQGTSGALVRAQQVEVIVDPRDFTIGATPPAISVPQGGSNTTTIATTSIGGVTGDVALSCTNVSPATAALTCGFDQTTITTGGTATLTLTGAPNLPGGTYTVTVQGQMTSPVARTRTTAVTVTVPDFGLGITPPTQTILPAATADYTVTTSALNGFAGNIALSCQVLTAPAGTACSVDASPVAAGSGTALHVTTSAGTPTGTYTVRLTGTSGVTTHTFDAQLVIGPPSSPVDFTITTSTPSRTVTRSGGLATTSYSVTVTANGGFAESVTIACLGQPAGVTCGSVSAFVPAASGTTKTITAIIMSSAAPGTYSFQLKATSATKTHSVNVSLTIN